MNLKIPTGEEIQEMDLDALLEQLIVYNGLFTQAVREHGFHSSEEYRHAIKLIQAEIDQKRKKK